MTLARRLQDTGAMTRRCLLYTLRNVDNLITMLFLPVMIMLLFVFVLGGAMQTGQENYITYALPGILLLTLGYGAGTTAVSVNIDMQTGIVDRFRSMPIGRTTLLTGHVLASVLKNLVSTGVVLGVAFLIGFRPEAGLLDWAGATGILLLYTLAMTWMAIVFGLAAKTPEGASAFSYVVLFLPYLSSGFVPTDSMPGPLRVFATYQPITPINESVRHLLLGGGSPTTVLVAVAWCAGLSLAAYLLAKRLYNHRKA